MLEKVFQEVIEDYSIWLFLNTDITFGNNLFPYIEIGDYRYMRHEKTVYYKKINNE